MINIQINTNSYNIDVAKIFGVCSAVFITCIYQEYLYQTRNKKSNDNDTIALSRAEIYERTGVKPKVHVKLDTGMNRIGVRADEAIDFIKEVQNSPYLDFRGIFTHLAAAEELDKTQEQFAKWDSVVDNIDTEGLLLHILNTAGTICYKKPNSNMCRI